MPVDRIYNGPDSIWGFWRILEDETSLAAQVPLEKISDSITNPSKRLEFLAGRALIKGLLNKWNLPYAGLTKDSFGKPYLTASDIQLSLSHSYPYVAAILHRHQNVGIDLEQPKNKLLRIAPRVLSANELADAGTDIVKHCIYWCAKEALVKIYGKKDLIFSKNLLITPFSRSSEGHLIGRILAKDTETAIPLEYIVSDNFVVVVSR
ncbi:MAG: 4'-phosphopantetheinyl transferase superfamily protein [Cyclobacteriaceae bacterium]